MSERLTAALLGFGAVASGRRGEVSYPMSHLAAYRSLHERISITAIADTDADRRRLAAREVPAARIYRDFNTLLEAENSDVVSVCLPPAHNTDGLLAAAAAGARAIWCYAPRRWIFPLAYLSNAIGSRCCGRPGVSRRRKPRTWWANRFAAQYQRAT